MHIQYPKSKGAPGKMECINMSTSLFPVAHKFEFSVNYGIILQRVNAPGRDLFSFTACSFDFCPLNRFRLISQTANLNHPDDIMLGDLPCRILNKIYWF